MVALVLGRLSLDALSVEQPLAFRTLRHLLYLFEAREFNAMVKIETETEAKEIALRGSTAAAVCAKS